MSAIVQVPFREGDVLAPLSAASMLEGSTRVLHLVGERDKVYLIDLPKRLPAEKPKESSAREEGRAEESNRMEAYVRGPYVRSLSELATEVRSHLAQVLNLRKSALSDADRRLTAKTAPQKRLLERAIARRDARFEIIRPLVCDPANNKVLRPIGDVLLDESMAENIRQRALECRTSKRKVYTLLHLFLALGSTKNALFSGHPRCGNPGKPKFQKRKLGRGTDLYRAGRVSTRGFALDKNKDPNEANDPEFDGDKQKLAWGYRLIAHSVRARDAYLFTSGIFYAEHELSPDGKRIPYLWPKTERPTFRQFMYWGKKLNNDRSIAEILLGAKLWGMKSKSRGGAVTDHVACVGQLAEFDATSTDTYLTSFLSRLKVLPPMTRMIIKDVRTQLIVGLYCGWIAESQAAALLCILHAASSKVEFCKRFDIDITDEDWPAILHRMFRADHGAMKGEAISEAEDQFHFGVDYPETERGDQKGGVESQHHADHKKHDEKIPGNAHGHPAERRRKVRPEDSALWNYYEYMRELILYILKYNNEEVPDLQPVDMLAECPDIRPTRLNIFKWLRNRGMTAELQHNVEDLRAFMLPDYPATIKKNGVYIISAVGGRERIIMRQRFSSPELIATGILSEVHRTGRIVRTRIKVDPEDLSKAWMPTTNGLIPLTSTIRDATLLKRGTLKDWSGVAYELDLQGKAREGEVEQADAEDLFRREAVTKAASAQRAEELANRKEPITKGEVRRSLRPNENAEVKLLAAMDAAQAQDASAPEDAPASPDDDPGRQVMDRLHPAEPAPAQPV